MPPASELAAELVASSAPQLVAFAIGAIAGSMVPTYYAQERLRGFGRALFARLPYQPPPGMQREEAMRAAVEDVDAEDAEEGDDAGA
ncbi:hypothetical protein [Halolamina sp. C58]|uniref:hypothetical protein n=1 Tax=Halolamina sp. C58 TaxID=3421640 RepID=UPI003EBD9476